MSSGNVAVVVAGPARVEADEAAPPAVGEGRRPARSRPRLRQLGHVVGLVLDPPAVVRPAGGELGVARAVAVDPGFVEPLRADVQPGRRHRRAGLEGAAKLGAGGQAVVAERQVALGGRVDVLDGVGVGRDPGGRPVTLAGLEPRARGARRAVGGPERDLPAVSGARAQRRPGVPDADRGGVVQPPARPQAVHLHEAGHRVGAAEPPGQQRRGGVRAERGRAVVTAQAVGPHGAHAAPPCCLSVNLTPDLLKGTV